jgi:uncharacterized protein YlxW (UPF0749 family)
MKQDQNRDRIAALWVKIEEEKAKRAQLHSQIEATKNKVKAQPMSKHEQDVNLEDT